MRTRMLATRLAYLLTLSALLIACSSSDDDGNGVDCIPESFVGEYDATLTTVTFSGGQVQSEESTEGLSYVFASDGTVQTPILQPIPGITEYYVQPDPPRLVFVDRSLLSDTLGNPIPLLDGTRVYEIIDCVAPIQLQRNFTPFFTGGDPTLRVEEEITLTPR